MAKLLRKLKSEELFEFSAKLVPSAAINWFSLSAGIREG